MSKFIQVLDAPFDITDLDYIRQRALAFHLIEGEKIKEVFKHGTTKIVPSVGYYMPLFGDTFEEKQKSIKSWTGFESSDTETFGVNTIKMEQGDGTHQLLHVIKPKDHFGAAFYEVLNRVLAHVPVKFDPRSPAISMQEFGYSMKFHWDAGVQARVHINLNVDCIDIFYTDDGAHRVQQAECFRIEASQTNHGFMGFQKEPRMHIMMDIL